MAPQASGSASSPSRSGFRAIIDRIGFRTPELAHYRPVSGWSSFELSTLKGRVVTLVGSHLRVKGIIKGVRNPKDPIVQMIEETSTTMGPCLLIVPSVQIAKIVIETSEREISRIAKICGAMRDGLALGLLDGSYSIN